MSIDWNAKEEVIYRKFKKYGTDMKFYHNIDGEKNDVTASIDWSNLITTVKGLASGYGDLFVDGDLIQKGDKNVVITMREGRPNLGDELKIGNTFFKVVNVSDMTPAGTTLMYKLHVRSYAVGEDIDRVFVDLRDLPVDSLVSDPNRKNTPIWRVIAHDHHKIGYTTLICNKIWEMVSFGGVPETGNVYPSSPWSRTFIRRYLINEFSKVLSAKMLANLQGVITTTKDESITDTITLLSKVELGGDPTQGVLNGTPMPYFEADSFRIAFYDDPERVTDLNTEYWTRDGWGVGSGGKIKTFNPIYKHGLRPVIFLRSGLLTALNFNGEYEVQFT